MICMIILRQSLKYLVEDSKHQHSTLLFLRQRPVSNSVISLCEWRSQGMARAARRNTEDRMVTIVAFQMLLLHIFFKKEVMNEKES